ncbi:MAG: hypothetical protein F6K17_31995 [Okeania sp. SIO3C4]|nr:hypothetical protein [Okeania sp. SIO3B3]NER06876.1 hypothetical protein [Okeania sp. SIO3C4]
MDSTTIVIVLAAVLGMKGLEKTRENIEQDIWDKSVKFLESFKQESPDKVRSYFCNSENLSLYFYKKKLTSYQLLALQLSAKNSRV